MDLSAVALFEDILASGASLRVRTTGGSMAPFINSGEIVTIQKVPCHELRIGDIVLIKNSHGFLALHRLIRIKRLAQDAVSLQTLGDALTVSDEPILSDSALGKAVLIEKRFVFWGVRKIDMNNPYWKAFNFFMALVKLMNPPARLLAVYRALGSLIVKQAD